MQRGHGILAVRITGADGYSAVVAVGEIAPEFAGHQVQLADSMNGAHSSFPAMVSGVARSETS